MYFLVFFYTFKIEFGEIISSKLCDGELCYPRIIWAYWNSRSVPDHIKEYVDFSNRSLVNFTLCLLTPANLSDYLDTQSFPLYFNKTHVAGQADYIRVCLLEKYGGIYIDISTYLNSESELEWLVSEGLKRKSNFITFKVRLFNKFPKLEFSYISAPEKSYFMRKFREELHNALSVGKEEYVRKTCASLRSDKLPIPDVICEPPFKNANGFYFIDVSFENVVQRNSKLKEGILFLPENRSNYHIWCDLNWNVTNIVKHILDDPQVFEKYPVIKINGGLRTALRKERKRRSILKKKHHDDKLL